MLRNLKRKVSRVTMEAPDPSMLQIPSNHGVSPNNSAPTSPQLPCQYEYQRPDLLGKCTEEEYAQFAVHGVRPVVTPKHPLPGKVGYAEAINAGKSKFNEDQAAVYEGSLKGMNGVEIPYLFIGLYDGHGGSGAAVKLGKELHKTVIEGLDDVLPYMMNPDKLSDEAHDAKETRDGSLSDDEEEYNDESVEVKMTVDELVSGSLESSFWAMDRLILKDKEKYKITGGATCLVALFICGKLYVANAGDSRAALYLPNESKLKQMSFDFTPIADRQRIQQIAYHRPELIRHPQTKEKLFNRHVLSRKVTKEDIGISIMYKDFYMTGWSCRDVTSDDVQLVPIISGRGKQCRLLSTVGVARSIGDHDLLAKGCGIKVKDFLTPQPEVRIYDLKDMHLTGKEVLVMGSDGLWDVLTNEDIRSLVSSSWKADEAGILDRPELLARKLVVTARGERMPENYWEMKNKKLASGDDITGVVAILKFAKRG